ncbi:right-handed parallel beta-helix repeat-containing protein [Corallococcus sp. CA049B]|uniref:right-handed parallel beta-helix repeat-containing protein n=1 Tax=Corallococcus sp. CA049B TaxID=2316730 RepID=UPI000EA0ACCE|nr:right-handed parallel beta-helix repeat-containing protein [Corallococcus sp. CA049B]RKG90089.1 right-handed parallel beta-helix repeat-containing protein [Corallococcus sp. CA049B]
MKQTRGFAMVMAVGTLLTGAPDVLARDTAPSDVAPKVSLKSGHAVRCGDTLTESTILTHDLNCPGSAPYALQLDGADVLLDLGGYTIRRTGPEVPGTFGIVVTHARMIRNGTVQGFGYGIDVSFSSTTANLRLHELSLLDNGYGVYSESQTNFLITHCRLSGNGRGLGSTFDASTGVFDVRSSIFTHNGIAMVADYHHIDLFDSTFTSNGLVSDCFGGSLRFRASTIAWNDAVGRMLVDQGPHTCGEMRFENSLIANNAAFAPADRPVWVTNRLAMINTMAVSNGLGLQASALTVYVDGNTFHDNGGGLTLSDLPAPVPVPLTGIVRGNQFLANDGDGLRVQPPSTPTVIDNLALNNTGFGIYAPTAFDGGGNVARNNTAGNCVGIVCAMD